jgi:hypothetical protein
MKRAFPLSALLLTTLGCGGPDPVEMPAPPPEFAVPNAGLAQVAVPAAPTLVASTDQAELLIGQVVRVMGAAADAKLSAVVQTDALLVYCMVQGEDSLLAESRWPEGVAGQQVEVTGTLVQSDQFTAGVGPDGAISQGTEGPILALVGFEHQLVPAAPQPTEAPEPASGPAPADIPLPEPAAD